MTQRVFITGYGAITPLGKGVDTFMDRWVAGETGVADGAARVGDFEITDYVNRKQARRMDRFTQFAMVAAREAIESVGWEDELAHDPNRIGCVIGTGIGGLGSLEREHNVLNDKGPKMVSPLSVPLMMGNAAPASVAMQNGLHGPTFGVVSACAAGAHAFGTAARMVACGDADAVLTGGSESALTGLATAAFMAMGATSPTGISRPFDARRDGFVMGEGAGVIVLESESAIERSGSKILGEVLGYAATSDAYHITAPDPEGTQSARAIKLALESAGKTPDDIDYINAHGTSTPLNDRSETDAIKVALGERAAHLPISSTKSVTGHLLGAAGAVEAIATIESLRRMVAPPTVGWEERDEGLDLDYVPDLGRKLENGNGSMVGISNSFGFGGHNAVLCLTAEPN